MVIYNRRFREVVANTRGGLRAELIKYFRPAYGKNVEQVVDEVIKRRKRMSSLSIQSR